MDLKLNEVKLQFEDLESTRRIKIKKQNDHNINISQNPSQDIHVKSDDFKSFKSDIVLMKLELTQILLEKENDIKYIQAGLEKKHFFLKKHKPLCFFLV